MPSRHWGSDVPYTSRHREGFPSYARLRTDNPHAVTAPQVGLGNVDNTSDADKPIGEATQDALDGKAPAVHTHAQSDITNLVADLALKAPLASPVFTGGVRWSSALTPATLAADVNDWAPEAGSPANVWVLTASVPVNITGVAPESGGTGRILILHNTTSTTITLKNNHAGSIATNRFVFSGGVDVVLGAVETIQLMKINTRWRALGPKF